MIGEDVKTIKVYSDIKTEMGVNNKHLGIARSKVGGFRSLTGLLDGIWLDMDSCVVNL